MKTKMIIKDQKGAAIVEFAIVAPLLLVLLFGIVEFGILLYNKAVITNACREGARAGIVLRNPKLQDSGSPPTPLDSLIQNTITTYLTNRLISFGQNNLPSTPGGWTRVNIPPIYDFDASITENVAINNEGDAGEPLTVQVRYYHQFLLLPNLMQLVKGNLTSTVTNNAVTVMRFE